MIDWGRRGGSPSAHCTRQHHSKEMNELETGQWGRNMDSESITGEMICDS